MINTMSRMITMIFAKNASKVVVSCVAKMMAAGVYTINNVDPPLHEVPQGVWICPICTSNKQNISNQMHANNNTIVDTKNNAENGGIENNKYFKPNLGKQQENCDFSGNLKLISRENDSSEDGSSHSLQKTLTVDPEARDLIKVPNNSSEDSTKNLNNALSTATSNGTSDVKPAMFNNRDSFNNQSNGSASSIKLRENLTGNLSINNNASKKRRLDIIDGNLDNSNNENPSCKRQKGPMADGIALV